MWLRLLVITLLLTGCAGGQQDIKSPKSNVAIIKQGVIESVTPISLDASSGGGGTLGSIFGQVGGASTGAGRGSVVGAVLGSVVGGTVGQQSGIDTRPGLEIWIKLDGEEMSTYVMQPGKPDAFKVGDRVRVLNKQGELRVEPLADEKPPVPEAPKVPDTHAAKDAAN